MPSSEGQDTNGSSTIIVQDVKQFPECVATVPKRPSFFFHENRWVLQGCSERVWGPGSIQNNNWKFWLSLHIFFTQSNNQRNFRGVVSECRACLQYTYQACIYIIYISTSIWLTTPPTNPSRRWFKTSHFHLPQVVRSHNLLSNGGFLEAFQKPGAPIQTSRFSRWVFPKIGVPQNGWLIMENPLEIHDLGVPLFVETPIYSQFSATKSSPSALSWFWVSSGALLISSNVSSPEPSCIGVRCSTQVSEVVWKGVAEKIREVFPNIYCGLLANLTLPHP